MTSTEFVTADRRRLESDIATLGFDLEDAQRGRYEAEKRTDRLWLEVSRLRHDLRQAQRRSRQHVVGVVNGPQRAKIREPSSGSCNITALQDKVTDIEQELRATQRDDLVLKSTTSSQVNSSSSTLLFRSFTLFGLYSAIILRISETYRGQFQFSIANLLN